MTIQSFIIRNAANLRCRFKTRQRDAKVAKHKVRMEFYRDAALKDLEAKKVAIEAKIKKVTEPLKGQLYEVEGQMKTLMDTEVTR